MRGLLITRKSPPLLLAPLVLLPVAVRLMLAAPPALLPLPLPLPLLRRSEDAPATLLVRARVDERVAGPPVAAELRP